jgi:CDP-diacylglycerol---serine O-phosphatidyltransferase
MAERPSARHFSMIRNFHLADFFTIANGFCGIAAVFEAMKFLATQNRVHLYVAALLIPLALVFDVLDGRIARWRHKASPMGRELDSLADVISFNVAPAGIAFAAGLDTVLDYNITAEALAADTGKVSYFEGTPVPTSLIPLGLLMLAFRQDALFPVRWLGVSFHLVTLLFVLSGSVMISKTLRIPKP